MRFIFSYYYADAVVQYALQVLREKSPVGSDKHPGLYRDSHTVFIDGHVVPDATSWSPGQQINISNPVPYARKIEVGKMQMSVPPHVYESATQLVADRYPQFDVRFVFMPVRFGSVEDYVNSATGRALAKKTRGGRVELHSNWLARQPAMQITGKQ